MRTKGLTEAVMMAVIYIGLLFLFMLPIISLVATFLLPLPFIIYRLRHSIKGALLLLVVTTLLTIMLFSVFYVPITIMVGAVGIVLGEGIAKKRSRIELYLKGTVTYLVGMVFVLLVGNLFFQVNFISDITLMLDETFTQVSNSFNDLGQGLPEKQLEMMRNSLELIPILMPVLFTFSALIMSFFTLILCQPILKRLGYKLEQWPPFHELSLPKFIIWFYLFILIISFIKVEQGTIIYNVILNSLVLFQLLSAFQGLTFISAFFKKKNLKKGWFILVIVSLFFVPPLFSIVMLLGIIDLGFSLRRKL